MLDIANMAGEAIEEPSAMYGALMAVKPDGLSLSRWADRAGVHRSIFNGIRRHGNPTADTLQKLLDAVDASLSDLYAHMPPTTNGNTLVRTEVRGTGMAARDVESAWHGPQPQKPVPLLGTAFGGEWSDGVEMTELHLTDVLDYLGRPPSVAGDSNAYAVIIVGESMAPRYEPGERVFVSPRSSVSIGNDVIVQLRAEDGDRSSQVADRVTMVLIKRLVRRTAKFVELQQFNPPETFQVPAERIAAIHRVRGRL